jgi:small-conductance mechanosensitive channel
MADGYRDDAQISHLRELLGLQDRSIREQIEALRKEWALSEKATNEALRIQRDEMARRLEGLNHEASRITAAAARSVSAELYQADQRTLQVRCETIERRHLEHRDALLQQLSVLRESVISDVNHRAGVAAAWAKVAVGIAIIAPILMRVLFS